jgi:hypothetical protein
MKMKYFATWKEACDYCASVDVSNECVQFDSASNRYAVNHDERGKVVEE